jgi:hypothetical protein
VFLGISLISRTALADQCPPGFEPSGTSYAPAAILFTVGAVVAFLLLKKTDSPAIAVLVIALTVVGPLVALLVAGFSGTCVPV